MLSKSENFVPALCENAGVRSIVVAVLAALMSAGLLTAAPPAAAEPFHRRRQRVQLSRLHAGHPAERRAGFVLRQPHLLRVRRDDWGRLVFCGSPRRYEPRWFRSPEMHGVKNEGDLCPAQDGEVAQAPDGLFLTCVARGRATHWERGDL